MAWLHQLRALWQMRTVADFSTERDRNASYTHIASVVRKILDFEMAAVLSVCLAIRGKKIAYDAIEKFRK